DFVDIVLSFRPPPEGIPIHFLSPAGLLAHGSGAFVRLPGKPSGVMDKSSPLTVAGAAADLMVSLHRTAFPLCPLGHRRHRHYNRIASTSNRLCDALTSPGDRAY